jgi:biotin carboxylase
VTPVTADRRRPLLVVAHGPRSQPPLQIAEAASGLCEIIWLIDKSDSEGALTSRLLKKVGIVINSAGLSPAEIASLLRKYSPDGVVAYRDEDVLLLSSIAAELGLDYHTPEVAKRLVDKLSQRQALRDGGLPTPQCWEIPNDRDPAKLKAIAARVAFPAVLKPRTSGGGQYTIRIEDAGDLVRQVALLPPEAGGETGMMVEQYLPSRAAEANEHFADYVSVESLVAVDTISHVAVNGRFPLSPPFRETGFFIPADLSRTRVAAVLDVATAALRAVGVRTGGFHTEIKLTPAGPQVIEVNGRIGGGVPEMLFQATGVSMLELSIRVALGEPVVVQGPIPCSRIGWCFLIQPPITAGRFVSVEGLDRLAELPGVNRVLMNRTPGDAIGLWDGTFHYICSIYGAAANYDEVLEIDRFLHEEVSIVYD